MTFNLLTSPWLPVRRRLSGFAWVALPMIAPADAGGGSIDDDCVEALAFPRPDWNAAVTEWLIGILAAAWPAADAVRWRRGWREPPSPDGLAQALAPLVPHFNGDGDGPLAFQDHDPLPNAEEKEVAQLLIDSPGAITLTKNTDLFIKRDRTAALCLPYAYAALITLQTYAPSGGAGHRTSMRGGGPLTTLIAPREAGSLWQRLWANVPMARERPATWPADDPRWPLAFPWLAPTLVSDKKVVVGPDRVTDWLPFFACPRRIRLAVEREGACALGGPADFGIVRQYRTQNYGANYTDWTHPLSPYRTDPKGVRFPVHPNPGSRGYRGWLGIWGGGSVEASRSVATWDEKRRDLEVDPRADVSAWGYDMDNMKACAWVDDRVPWFAFDQPETRQIWLSRASAAIGAAGVAAAALGLAIRRVRAGVFSHDANGTEQFRVREDASLDLSVDAQSAFWAETEPLFRDWLDKLAPAPDDPQQTRLREWRDGLRHATLDLFDRFAGLPEDGDSTPDAMKCWAKARAALDRAFSDHAKAEVTAALKLDIPDTQGGKRRKAKQEPMP